MTAGGIFPALVGTVWLVAVALIASVPIGVAAAFYLSEYAPDNTLTRAINLAIINLAGVPSVVHALFRSGRVRPVLPLRDVHPSGQPDLACHDAPGGHRGHPRVAAGGAVHAFREACWSQGATRWQTIRRVVLPNAVSGILTGIILEVSRTAGETVPIMFTGAATFIPFLPQSVMDQTMAMSLHLFTVSTQVTDVPEALPYGVALVLISLVLAMNALVDRVPHLPARQEEVVGDNADAGVAPSQPVKIGVRELAIRYDAKTALANVDLDIRRNEIFGIIGPAGSGKTSFLKALGRMDEFNRAMKVEGQILFDGKDVRDFRNVYGLRRRIGVVFPLPVGLPMTIYDNVALSPRLSGIKRKPQLDEIVERCTCVARRFGTK